MVNRFHHQAESKEGNVGEDYRTQTEALRDAPQCFHWKKVILQTYRAQRI